MTELGDESYLFIGPVFHAAYDSGDEFSGTSLAAVVGGAICVRHQTLNMGSEQTHKRVIIVPKQTLQSKRERSYKNWNVK